MTGSDASRPDPAARRVVIVRGEPTDHELAALVTTLAALIPAAPGAAGPPQATPGAAGPPPAVGPAADTQLPTAAPGDGPHHRRWHSRGGARALFPRETWALSRHGR